MDQEIERLLNASWWVGALAQRHELDLRARAEGRAHQSVSDAHPERPLGPAYQLTPWDKRWICERVTEALAVHERRRDAARELLKEKASKHVARATDEAAIAEWGVTHGEAAERLLAGLANADAAEREAIDRGVDFIKRHAATVEARVEEERQTARDHKGDADAVLALSLPEHIAIALAYCEAGLRACEPVAIELPEAPGAVALIEAEHGPIGVHTLAVDAQPITGPVPDAPVQAVTEPMRYGDTGEAVEPIGVHTVVKG